MQLYDYEFMVKQGKPESQWEAGFMRAREKFGDDGKPLTPWTLVCEMFSKVPEKKGKCLIIGDFNLLHYAVNYGNFDEVWFVPVNSLMEGLAKFSGSMKEKVIVLPIEYNNLIESTKKELGDMKFDVIVGNPPYQNNNESGNFSLWPAFIKLAAVLLSPTGYMSMIVPQTWALGSLNPVKRAKDTMTIRYELFSSGSFLMVDFSCADFFNVGSTFCYFVWQNGIFNDDFEIHSHDKLIGTIKQDAPYVPIITNYDQLVNWTKFMEKLNTYGHSKLINGGREISGYRNGSPIISNIQSSDYCFEVYNTSAQFAASKKLFASIDQQSVHCPKVVVSDSGYGAPFYDKDGYYLLGHHGRAYEVETDIEAANILNFFASEYFNNLALTKPGTGSASKETLFMYEVPKFPVDVLISDFTAFFRDE